MLHGFFMDVRNPAPPRSVLSHWNVLITVNLLEKIICIAFFSFPWSPFIHDLMELPKSWLKSGHLQFVIKSHLAEIKLVIFFN